MKDRPQWQQAFLANTTRIGFKLIMTQPMLEMLCATASDLKWDRWWLHNILMPCNWLATEHALTARGLVLRKSVEANKARMQTDAGMVQPCIELTPAGEAVVAMLKVGGLFIEAKEAKRRMMKRKGAN